MPMRVTSRKGHYLCCIMNSLMTDQRRHILYLCSNVKLKFPRHSSITALARCSPPAPPASVPRVGWRQGSGVRRNVHVTILKLGDIWENDRSVLLPGRRMGPPDGLGST